MAEYTNLTTDSKGLNVLPNLEESNKAYRVIVNGTKGNEFFVLENRQQSGWDKYLPGHGMLMWHIDYDKDAWKNDVVNVNNAHQRVDIVEADGIASASSRAGDPFPGTSGVTSWNMESWGGETVLALDDIEEKNGVINILLGGLDITLDAPLPQVSGITENSAQVSWGEVPIAKEYVMNLYQVEGNKKTSVANYTNKIFSDPATVTLEGLQPETSYQVSLKAQRGSYTSEATTVDFKTAAIPFAKLSPANLKISDITNDGCKLTWDAVKGADDYEVTLGSLQYADDVEQAGYDFSDQLNGMPSLWDTNGSFINSTYGKAAPSLRMLKDGSYLVVAYQDALLSSARLWAKSSNSAEGNILVQVKENDSWKTIKTIPVDDKLQEGETIDCDFAQTPAIRFYVERDNGTFYLDDISVGCHYLKSYPLVTYNGISTAGNAYISFSGLKSDVKYLASVVAKQGSESSVASQMRFQLDQSTAIKNHLAPSVKVDAVYYDLNGRRVPAALLGHGVYIVKQANKTYKIVR